MTNDKPRFKWQITAINALLIVLPPLFWAGNFIAARGIRNDLPPVTLAFYRWIIAVIVLLPFSIAAFRRDWRKYREHPWLILGLSITGITAFNTLIYVGLQTTAAANGLIINACLPLMILLLGALFYGQPLRLRQSLGMLLSFGGVLTIVTRGDLHVLTAMSFGHGDIYILSGLLCWAFYTHWLKYVPAEVSRVGLMSVQMIVGLVFLAPFYGWEVEGGGVANWNMHAFLALAYVGIIPSVMAYLLYNACVDRMGPAPAGMSIYLMPVFGVMLSVFVLGEMLHWYQLLGVALIFFGIFVAGMMPKWRRDKV
ncbi:DMT family transporter [Shewanella sp. A32]|uniref:DMT family transporter n=1 Tax=Shewanella sp. A32 TaxID=3031327 RepID=UPI0023B944AA|nr:DMT family transporter [Shewanella sp. A32]MDF0535399.1 DMT family transporter [Shewanella sp. A32]